MPFQTTTRHALANIILRAAATLPLTPSNSEPLLPPKCGPPPDQPLPPQSLLPEPVSEGLAHGDGCRWLNYRPGYDGCIAPAAALLMAGADEGIKKERELFGLPLRVFSSDFTPPSIRKSLLQTQKTVADR